MKNIVNISSRLSTLFTLMILAVLMLSACGGGEAEPTAEPEVEQPPTEVPATEPPPTEESVEQMEAEEHVPDPNLIDKTWAWESKDPNGSDVPAIEVPNPENYTLVFNEDGTFAAELDCNSGNGSYMTRDIDFMQPSIQMALGPMTMAACEEGSFAPEMGQMIESAKNYQFEEDGQVVKFLSPAGGPIYTYRNVTEVDLPEAGEGAAIGTVTAPDGVFLRTGPGTNYPYVGAAPFGETGEIIGVSEDSLWWQADAPNLPEEAVWVTAEWVEVTGGENVPVVAAPPLEPTLTDVPWEWVSTTDPAQGTVAVNDPSRYVILFNEDGTAFIQADCNTVQTTYTTDGSSISITAGPSTMAACPPDSLDSQFLTQLANVAIYFIEGGNLFMDQQADSGTLRFVPQGTPPPNPDAPAGEGEGLTFYLLSYGPQDAPQDLIPGTQITASFADDVVTGNAGCNNYSGALTPVNDYFTVGPILVTQQFCSEPAGVMDQEQAYLAALEGTSGYEWEQTRRDDGTLVTEGRLFYNLPDGTIGALNLSTSPE